MNTSVFLSLYEKLESLVQRLPEGLRTPILREITPIKTLFLLQRPPRLVLVGDRAASRTGLVNALFGAEVARGAEDAVQTAAWQDFVQPGRGTLRVLDARRPASLAELTRALSTEPPDIFLFLRESGDQGLTEDLDHALAVLNLSDRSHERRPKVVGVPSDAPAVLAFDALHNKEEIAPRLAAVVTRTHGELLAETIAIELPPEAQLEMARLSGNLVLQKQLAQVVVKSGTAMCAAVAAQPIPLADFPILTSLQATMVASVMHISGREMSPKLAAKFLGALGANIGAGLVLREGARAAARFVPVWGSAISSAVAGAGTYAIGRAAIAYFIEGVSIGDARSIFRNRKKEAPLLKG